MRELVEFGDGLQEFVTEMLLFQQIQAQAQLKMVKFRINCGSEAESDKWLHRTAVEPFSLANNNETGNLRQRKGNLAETAQEKEEEEVIPFLSREQEFKRVCQEFRNLVQNIVLPLAQRKLELHRLLQVLQDNKNKNKQTNG